MKTNNVEIRHWTPEDLGIYVKLIKESPDIANMLRPGFSKIGAELFNINETNSRNGVFFNAIVFMGVIAGGISYEVKKGNIIELGHFWIAKDFRKSGIGRDAVLKLIEKLFAKYLDHKIILQVISSNVKAIKLFFSLGFQIREDMEETAIDNNGKPVTLFYFEKCNDALVATYIGLPETLDVAKPGDSVKGKRHLLF